MRRLLVLGMAGMAIGLGGFVRSARAGATVDLLFVGRNGQPIAPSRHGTAYFGETATMAIVLRNDQALTAAIFSIAYDLGGQDALDVVSALQWRGLPINKAGTDFFAPLSGLNPISRTFVGPFQGVTTNLSLPRTLPPAGGAFAGGYQMGTVVWRPRGCCFTTLVGGIIDASRDVLGDAGFNDISDLLQPGVATFTLADEPIPEPGTAALLGLGLAVLAFARRRGG